MVVYLRCVGCGRDIGSYDEHNPLCLTCVCNANTFFDADTEALAPPASLILAVTQKKEIPHLDYYLGYSDHVSELKIKLLNELRELGGIWSWECDQCRVKFLRHIMDEIKEFGKSRTYPYIFHPELAALLEEAGCPL